jgi:hypothetical protein
MAPWTKAQLALRNAHLKTFYGPYFGHLTARTPEYIELGKSGLVWDRIYKLRNITPWKTAERTLTRRLQEIDTLRETLKQGVGNRTSDRSFANFVSKSCEIEHNSLSVSDALRLSHLLTEGSIFSSNPILSTVEMELPSAENLALSLGHPPARTQEVLELRNHIFALKAALSDEYLRREETPESLLEDVRNPDSAPRYCSCKNWSCFWTISPMANKGHLKSVHHLPIRRRSPRKHGTLERMDHYFPR